MTRWYWHKVTGLLLEEFCLVNRTATCGGRWVDALVLPERDTRIAGRSETIDIAPGERAILVQTKASRLGMYLMGQTLFSAELLRRPRRGWHGRGLQGPGHTTRAGGGREGPPFGSH